MNRHNIQQYYIILSKIRVQWSQETTTKTKEIASVEATQCLPSLNCKSNLNNLFRHMIDYLLRIARASMHDVTLVILNCLRIKCHIRRPLMSSN